MVHSPVRSTVSTTILGCDVHRPYDLFVRSMIGMGLLTDEMLVAALGPHSSREGLQKTTQSVCVEHSSGSIRLEIEDTETLSDSFFRFVWIEDNECLLLIISPTSTDPMWNVCAAGVSKSPVLRNFCALRWPRLCSSVPLIGVPHAEWYDWSSPFICSFLDGLIEVFAAYEPTHSVVRLRVFPSL
ncbi:MAG: hypothetical protein KIH65_004555 [Candidatus Uhrbacteria bacterium]|nr:hypothetical protein [Candidatus Uhrbacteria bacterium]